MHSLPRSMTLLPHEVNEIDRIFQDILRERGLSRDCESAEVIARRIFSCYQRGIRESGALKYMTGFDKRSVAPSNAAAVIHGIPEVSLQQIAGEPAFQISPDELDMLQRTFDRVCTWCSIPRYGKRAQMLARNIIEQFRNGVSDEAALFESAMWQEQHSNVAQYQTDA
ncbi:hypothetical protein N183_33585 [Sinorhizobium sp. Sb3]|uniref:hypothetical protein n=1 Tax=Sinorhizobium/Ensifer group TaxID=227292 RepID=UPI00072B98A0|nr:hypothetical protein [Sinorhizobium sp. Sb3]KSV66081.1 hypothetical protein N183_33585 [Sinorhizobium sp. Sb3]